MAPLPVAVAGSAAALGVDGKIYVVGGLSGGVATNVVQAFDPAANLWTISTSLPESLNASAMGVDSLGRLIVMGGADTNGSDISDVWRSQPLGLPDAAPQFTQLPATNAIYGHAYSSTISATGNPPPTYALVRGPAGMTVDTYTGAIAWTPQGLDQIGSIPVTMQALNYAGTTNWDFTISVPYPRPAPVTNLAVVSVTSSSVTLSWSAEDAIYGPMTYGAYLRHVAHSPRGSGDTIWYTQIGTNATVPTITITGLTPGLGQDYYIVAVGPAGSSGTNSFIYALTASVQPPPNLRMTGLTSTTISLAWDPSPGQVPAASYQVWGWSNGGVNSAIYGSGITNTYFTITGLTPGTSHQWGVRAFDAQGYASAFNYGFTAVNPIPAPAQLNSAASTASGDSQFTISLPSGSQTILIQATTDLTDPNSWVQIGSLLPATNPFTFTDTNSAQYPARFYRILSP
jgi:hypothetical protein